MKRNICLWIYIPVGIFLLALTFNSAFAETVGFRSRTPPLMLNEAQGEYLLGTHIEYLEDPSQILGIEQVSSQGYDGKFIRGDVGILNFGLKDSAYWLRFTVRNEAQSENRWLLELERPSMNSVFMYAPSYDGNGFIEKKTGYVFPFSTRDMPHENFIFNLDIASGHEQTYYLRVKDMSLDLPLRIWSDKAFNAHEQTSQLIIGLSFGALLVMLVYNIVLLFILRDRSYLYYALFQLFLLLYLGSIQGYAPRYLWANAISLNFFVIPLFIELSAIFLLLFAGVFLRFDSRTIWFDRIRYVLTALLAFSIPPTLIIGARVLTVVLPLVLAVFLYAFVLGVWALRRGYKPARYYLFAWSIFLIFGFGAVLQREGWLAINQAIPEQAIQLGAVYLVTFQSLALADRIGYYKQEHLNAQTRLISQQKETLHLKDELNITLENARLKLEDRVAERTQELIGLNTQLSEEIIERKRVEGELERLASVDSLTNLFNRRHFFELAAQEFVKSIRYDKPLSVIIFDIDLFKNINDTYGHLIGDQALTHIGNLVREMTRKPDIAARYGGEEFVVFLPETDCASARIFADRLRQLVADSPVSHNGDSFHLTVSVGVSGKDSGNSAENFDQLISQADMAMYKAKNSGRNQTVCYWEDL